MAKAGILHDYDLMANAEPAARRIDVVCVICGATPPTYQWSDYSGEAMCVTCGCPYQLKWGSNAQQAEGKYPYLNLRPEAISAIREYWQETQRWTCFGTMLGHQPGLVEFAKWCKAKHPELCDAPDKEG